jgi:hypothetical protein
MSAASASAAAVAAAARAAALDAEEAEGAGSAIAKEEEDGGYSDAMLSMDRTRAEGYAEGLQAAYTLIYGGSNE